MIMYVKGNLFESPAKVLVNTVNTVGVMGKGIAKRFKEIYPEMFRQYQLICEKKQLQVGKLWLFKSEHKWILNFPTKVHWRQPSKPEYVKQGLEAFVATYAGLGITSVAFPRLGCGNGELDWQNVVRPMMTRYLRKLAIDIFIYEFNDENVRPEHKDIEAMTAWLRNEPRTLAFLEVWADLINLVGSGIELRCWDSPSRFRVTMTERPGKGLMIETAQSDERRSLLSRFLKIVKDSLKPRLVGPGSVFVPQEAMLDLWQAIRAYGFCIPGAMPEGLDVLSPYVTALLSRLEYMKPVEISSQTLCGPAAPEIGLRLFAGPATSHSEQSEPAYMVQSALKQQPWLGPARSWWPDYLFRFDDIRSAANILNSGSLLSRAQATSHGVMAMDCASADVIAQTADQWKQYVRLYFRPRTPMQYDIEGIRPVDHFVLDAHCPVPVVMLFGSLDVLTRTDTRFSEGNLAADATVGDDAHFLEAIPFREVYHNTWFEQHEKASIIFHRHAEVIVPNKLDLTSLKYVVCRTQAEFETLLLLLEPEARKKWSTHIGPVAKANLHFRHWTFVEAVELSRDRIRVKFNPSSKTPGPFHANVEVKEDATGKTYSWENAAFQANDMLPVSIERLRHPESYSVRVELDGNLAYLGHYQEGEGIPF